MLVENELRSKRRVAFQDFYLRKHNKKALKCLDDVKEMVKLSSLSRHQLLITPLIQLVLVQNKTPSNFL